MVAQKKVQSFQLFSQYPDSVGRVDRHMDRQTNSHQHLYQHSQQKHCATRFFSPLTRLFLKLMTTLNYLNFKPWRFMTAQKDSFAMKTGSDLSSTALSVRAVVSHSWYKQRAVVRKQNIEQSKVDEKEKLGETPFSANKLTFHQVPLHIPFTFIGLSPCSITKVLTGADYSNKSCGPRGGVTQRTGMQKGLPEGQHWPGLEPCPKDGWHPLTPISTLNLSLCCAHSSPLWLPVFQNSCFPTILQFSSCYSSLAHCFISLPNSLINITFFI